jgi:hypothetical protein
MFPDYSPGGSATLPGSCLAIFHWTAALLDMKLIFSTLLTLSLLAGGAAFAGDTESSGGKTHSSSKKHNSGTHHNNRNSSHKKNANVPSGK